ncbi:hypothetical protein Back2_28080 [Nocardioides baekrokdamisoli]|uniref:Uncharacterized protein n=1 Tax=Nocardioides baekrokdamisoli TaxID=1804624 RepID=A0A3G9IXV8_9ACTN|nr:hypothetical protein Back2_28080 [Nocardioides baekrokdamisoli]
MPELGQRGLDEVCVGAFVGDVGGYDQGSPAGGAYGLGHLLQTAFGSADQDEVGAHRCGFQAERATESRSDARQDDDFAFKQCVQRIILN